MSRNISSPMLAALTSCQIAPCFLLDIALRSMVEYVWSGQGTLVYGGNSYRGLGSLGKVDAIAEGVEVNADGTSVTLSGIDIALLSETLTDVQLGAPVTLYFALLDASSNFIGTPYPLFVGTVDQPVIKPDLEEFSITIKLENRLTNLQRANMRRYTQADQALYYPSDTAFNRVSLLNDQALRWG